MSEKEKGPHEILAIALLKAAVGEALRQQLADEAFRAVLGYLRARGVDNQTMSDGATEISEILRKNVTDHPEMAKAWEKAKAQLDAGDIAAATATEFAAMRTIGELSAQAWLESRMQ